MPEEGNGWSRAVRKRLQDQGFNPDKFVIDARDDKGHYERIRDVNVPPTLFGVAWRLALEIPPFNKQMGGLVRYSMSLGCAYLLDVVEDPKTRDSIRRDFQLHQRMEEQARETTKYAEMQRYVSSCRASLSLYSQSGNWMKVSQELEKIKKDLDAGLVWETAAGELREIVREYEAKLKLAKP